MYFDSYAALPGRPDGILLTQRTGELERPSRRGCSPVAIGGPWLEFDCGPGNYLQPAALYRLATGRWLVIKPAPRIARACAYTFCDVSPLNVGTYWVEFGTEWISSNLGSNTRFYQNISTGTVRAVGPDAIADPNSPRLVVRRARCSLPPDGGSVLGQDGSTVLADSGTSNFLWFERCDAREQHKVFVCADAPGVPFVFSRHALICEADLYSRRSNFSYLTGALVPSGHAVRLPLPAPVQNTPHPTTPFALTERELYVITMRGVYVARSPGI